MTTHRSAADRIRPILQAMEDSINSARRSRVKDSAPAAPVAVPAKVVKPPSFLNPAPPQAPAVKLESQNGSTTHSTAFAPSSDSPQRLKAKPKRVNSAFASPFEQQGYRSQAG